MQPMEDPKLIEILTRMETKLDNMISSYHDHETRLRTLEKKIWSFPSLAAIIGIAGTVISLLVR